MTVDELRRHLEEIDGSEAVAGQSRDGRIYEVVDASDNVLILDLMPTDRGAGIRTVSEEEMSRIEAEAYGFWKEELDEAMRRL